MLLTQSCERMLQPNKSAGFEVTAQLLFPAFFNATQPQKASNFKWWKE